MRLASFILLAGVLASAPTLSASDSPDLIKARAEVDRIRLLVDAGTVPHAALEKAELRLADVQDQATLEQALYGEGVNLTNDKALEMLHAAERGVERQQMQVEQQQELADQGVLARNEVTPLVEELDRRKQVLDLAGQRYRLIEELSKTTESEKQVVVESEFEAESLPISEHFVGTRSFTRNDFRRLSVAYQKQFGQQMPVSAMGMTALHRSLGFDHRGRIDVAINPDQEEGRWLRAYLEKSDVSYYAFRGRVRRKATGAHIHIGPPSLPLRRVATTRHHTGKTTRRSAD